MLSHLSCLRDTYDLGIAVNLSCPQFYTFEICTYLHKQYTSLLFHIWKFFFHWPFCILNKHIFIFIDWFLVLKTVVHIICGLLSFFIINDLQEILTFCIISKYLLKAQKKIILSQSGACLLFLFLSLVTYTYVKFIDLFCCIFMSFLSCLFKS